MDHDGPSNLPNKEGLPGTALNDEASPADDFVMIANDLLHSAAQSCSKDVVSIGMGQLEDGLCDRALEVKTERERKIRKQTEILDDEMISYDIQWHKMNSFVLTWLEQGKNMTSTQWRVKPA